MNMKNPVLIQGLVYFKRLRKAEKDLLQAYWNMGSWLLNDLPQAGIPLAEFQREAGVSRQTLMIWRDVVKIYGDIKNIPEGYSYTTAYKFRKAYAEGLQMPEARQSGKRPSGICAVIERSNYSQSVLFSALREIEKIDSISDEEYEIIDETVAMIRAHATDMIREAKRKLDLVPIG